MLLGQQVVGQWRRVGETLHSGVEEAGVAQVVEAGSNPVHPLPLHGELVPWKEQLLWCRDAISLPSTKAIRHCRKNDISYS